MPDARRGKDERQYQHVKDRGKRRGASGEQAEEIAARTVNKHRREKGRTPNGRSQGTGNPNRGLADLSKGELYNRAKEKGIGGRSQMSRAKLVSALNK